MKTRPNIVFVLTDDQGYGDIGCTGNPIVKTPNIDNFYNESVHLTNFHVGPTCAPTRAGLMTGHYANSTGVWHTIGGRSLLRKNEWTLASALKESGYITGIFGKWHLGDEYPYRPHDRGFDKAIVHGGGGISQIPDYWGNDYFDDTYFINGKPQKHNGYCTDVFFNEGLKFIEENKDKPFFCYIATNAPHLPLNVDNKYSDMYQGKTNERRARFYGMITNIDENFGVLREKLKEWNLNNNTILIFMTDNGTATGVSMDSKNYVVDGYNAGLRGGKGSEYDGGHRVPVLIRWPNGDLIQSKDIDELTANVDFMPTILDLCDVQVKDDVSFHGKSIKPLLYDEGEWEQRTMVTDSQRVAYPVKWRKSAVMSNRWRLVNGRELYDAQEDREQRNDVAENNPAIVKQLRKEYEKWWDIVSEQYDDVIPIALGENATAFTSHDMRNEECSAWSIVYSQRQVRKGVFIDGYWEIEVESDGLYKIYLSRWPLSENRPIKEGIDGDDLYFERDFILEKDWECYTGGISMNINEAFIDVQGNNMKIPVNENDDAATFKVALKKGNTSLKAWFGDGNKAITSAYYVYCEKIIC